MRLPTKMTLALTTAAMAATTVVACEDEKSPTPATPTPTAAATTENEPDGRNLSDADVTEAVRVELAHDAMVPDDAVTVSVLRGIVSLTGKVPHLLAKERATHIAGAVRGVRSVSNRIAVEPTERVDDQIRRDIEHELLVDRATESYEVTPEVSDGVVTLTGSVDSWQEKQLAGRIAKRVKGVVELNNEITIDPKGDRDDDDIQAEIEHVLEWDALVDDGLIEVAVDDGSVKLEGVVGSAAERQRAASDAYVTGVKAVDPSGLEIKWWAEDKNLRKRRSAMAKTDEEVEQAILAAMVYDPRVDAGDIEVEARKGDVTLDGYVATQKAKRVAERLARNTVGVYDVNDSLEIAPPPHPIVAAALEKQIERSLLLNPVTESYEIDVAVVDGDVVLTGKVDSFFERAEATDVALRQVNDEPVINKITVDDPTTTLVLDRRLYPGFPDVLDWTDYARTNPLIDDPVLLDTIQNELFWDPDVDSWQVKVKVDSGKVILTGKVDTWYERWAAETNAFEAGAIAVDNRLEI